MKKNIFIIISVVIILTIISVGTYAYFSYETTVKGIVTSGSLKLKVNQETLEGQQILDKDINIMPGDTIERIVTVENIGNQSLYLRIKVITKVDDEQLSVENCLSMNIDNTYWTYEDGYYYYYKMLEPGEKSEELFSEVHISGENVDNKYLGKIFILDIVAQATQVKNNSDNALDAFGWPE